MENIIIKILLGIGILVATYFLYRAIRRIVKGIISYRKLGKEEFKKRLSDGFQSITPAQKTKGELVGILISLVGMTFGIVVMSIIRIAGIWYWAVISLSGGAIVTVFQLIGKLQQYKTFKLQDEKMAEIMIMEAMG